MTEYTVHLFRSGRVWVSQQPTVSRDVDPPLLTAQVTANTPVAALGKLLLTYVDKANQPSQHVCMCTENCCTDMCYECGRQRQYHRDTQTIGHHFVARHFEDYKQP